MFRILLYGAGGVGKTEATLTCLKNKTIKRLIYLQTERNSSTGIASGLKRLKITPQAGQIIVCYPDSPEDSFGNMLRALDNFQNESKTSALKGDPRSTQNKGNYGYLSKILNNFQSFSGVDYVTGEVVKLGNVSKLAGSSDVLIVDGHTVLANEVWKSFNGDKILKTLADYGPVQQFLYNIYETISKVVNANVIVLCHEKDKTEEALDANGNSFSKFIRSEPNTLCGNSNFETLMGTFTHVIRATRVGVKYVWEIGGQKSYSIARGLPTGITLEPDFSLYSSLFEE